jgi:RNA polymerase sigma-70 factor (ECF subfamily)
LAALDDRKQATDEDLVRHSRAGDAAALAQLYQRHAPRLLGYLRRSLRQHEEAEDVLQDTFLGIFEGRGSYAERGRFRSWLYTIATRKAMDRIRNDTRRAALLTQYCNTHVTAPDPLQQSADRQILERVEAVLQTLPPEYLAAFHLRIREGFRYAEIASISGDSEGTLRSRIHHALKKINQALFPNAAPQGRASRSIK